MAIFRRPGLPSKPGRLTRSDGSKIIAMPMIDVLPGHSGIEFDRNKKDGSVRWRGVKGEGEDRTFSKWSKWYEADHMPEMIHWDGLWSRTEDCP